MAWNIALPNAEYFHQHSPGLDGLVRQVADLKELAIDTETDGLIKHRCKPYYWSISFEDDNGRDRRITLHANTLDYFKRSFDDYNKKWIFANAKFDCHMLANVNCDIKGTLIDVAVQHALLHEGEPHGLKDMARTILGWKWTDFTDTFGSLKSKTCLCGGTEASHRNAAGICKKTGCMEFVQTSPLHLLRKAERENINLLVDYAANDAYGTWHLKKVLDKKLEEAETDSLYDKRWPYIKTLKDYFYQTEVPFTRTLYVCERNGMKIDRDYLVSLGPGIQKELQDIQFQINHLTGRLLNPKSGDQKIAFFCDEHRIRPKKMTKGGKSGIKKPSIDEKFLEYVADEYVGTIPGKVAALIVEYSKIDKQYGTYIEKMPGRLDDNERVHPSLNQDVARTGRLSCVAGWTKLNTQRGILAISDVVAGDYVWTHKQRQQRVLASFTKGIGHMYDVHLCNGQILTCTTAHRLLNKDKEWVTLGAIINEHFKGVGSQQGQPDSGANPIQSSSSSDHTNYSQAAKDPSAQRGACAEDTDAGGRAAGIGQGALLSLKDRQQEPDERKDGQGSSQLDRGVRGRVWVPNVPTQRATDVRAPCSGSAGFGPTATTENLGGAPHRHRPEEQRPGQPGHSDKEGTPGYPLFAGEGLDHVEITKVHYRGSFEVHDITVEHDESYEACGVFSHNSSNPNLQNVTGGEKDRFKLRGAFIAEKGCSLIVADYSALEMRILAAGSEEQGMMDIFHHNWDIHMGNASLVFGIPYEDLVAAKKLDKAVKEGKAPASALDAYFHRCMKARGDAKCVHPETILFAHDLTTELESDDLEFGAREESIMRPMKISEFDMPTEPDTFKDVQYGAAYEDKDANYAFAGGIAGSSTFGTPVAVTATYNGGVKQLLHVISKRGILTCSGNHRFKLTDGSLVRAADLKKGMKLARAEGVAYDYDEDREGDGPMRLDGIGGEAPVVSFKYSNRAPPVEIQTSEDLAYFAGAFVGDGTKLNNHTVGLTHGTVGKTDSTGIEYAAWQKHLADLCTSLGMQPVLHDEFIYLGGRALCKYMQALELLDDAGKTLRIPKWVLERQELTYEFLGGLFDTDGTVRDGAVSFTTKDAILAGQVAAVLSYFGVLVTIDPSYNKTYERYDFRVRLAKGDSLRLAKYMRHVGKALEVAPLKAPREADEDEVKLVLDAGMGPCVDITVNSPDHLYVANGFITHNTIGFGLNYGMKEKALARRMGCEVEEAIEKMEQYMATYPAVRRFFDEEAERAELTGYSYTLMGRRRYLPDMRAIDDYTRFRAQRQSSNFPIQGTAAEVCKMAMINLSEDYELRDKYGYRMCLQVHDEIVGECPDEYVDICKARVKEWMEHPFPTDIGVPLTAEIGAGKSWSNAK